MFGSELNLAHYGMNDINETLLTCAIFQTHLALLWYIKFRGTCWNSTSRGKNRLKMEAVSYWTL